jgi:uncharacterized protein YjbJ (UPF0337 family)
MGGETDRVEGELKEQEGKLTDDEMREKQGQAQQKWGEAKDKAEDVKEEARDRMWGARPTVQRPPRRPNGRLGVSGRSPVGIRTCRGPRRAVDDSDHPLARPKARGPRACRICYKET